MSIGQYGAPSRRQQMVNFSSAAVAPVVPRMLWLTPARQVRVGRTVVHPCGELPDGKVLQDANLLGNNRPGLRRDPLKVLKSDLASYTVAA